MGAETRPIEIVDYGEPSGTGLSQLNGGQGEAWKFLLVENDASLFFIVGPLAEYSYHAGLLEAFCADREIPSHWENKPDVFRLDDDDFSIRGGGWIQFDPRRNRLVFSGRSTAYGEFDSVLVKEVVDSCGIFHGLETIIR
jgi:hypothetical protein